MTCHCEQCSSDPKPTYTEQFRHKTYMNFIVGHSDEWIKNYLQSAIKTIGVAAQKKLRNDVAKAWKERRENNKVINLNDRRRANG